MPAHLLGADDDDPPNGSRISERPQNPRQDRLPIKHDQSFRSRAYLIGKGRADAPAGGKNGVVGWHGVSVSHTVRDPPKMRRKPAFLRALGRSGTGPATSPLSE